MWALSSVPLIVYENAPLIKGINDVLDDLKFLFYFILLR